MQRGLLLIGVAFAVVLMHSVIMHADADGHHPTMTAMPAGAGAGTAAPAVADASDHAHRQQISSGADCDMHMHPCVFVRADLPVLLFVLVALLWWGFPGLRRPATRWSARIVELGRPPPWARYSHLDLQVIRC